MFAAEVVWLLRSACDAALETSSGISSLSLCRFLALGVPLLDTAGTDFVALVFLLELFFAAGGFTGADDLGVC